eukprot:UN23876
MHEREAVSDLALWKGNRLLSAGRDGNLKCFDISELKNGETNFQFLWSSSRLPIRVVEKIIVTPNNEIYVCGFFSSRFIVWSIDYSTIIFDFVCGGLKRPWSFQFLVPGQRQTGFMFTYCDGKNVDKIFCHHV